MSLDNTKSLPAIPAKRYFTIGEVSELCGVKAYVLRYWEQEFTQLKPVKRRGNRRYSQHHEVLLIRRIRELLYEQGFTISGARNRLSELSHGPRSEPSPNGRAVGLGVGLAVAGTAAADEALASAPSSPDDGESAHDAAPTASEPAVPVPEVKELSLSIMRSELISIRSLLTV